MLKERNNSIAAHLQQHLHELHVQGLERRLLPAAGLDFASNDYLGFSHDARLRAAFSERMQRDSNSPLGAPASRLLRGHWPAHAQLEQRLARFKGSEAALLFASGYMANLALLTALLRPGDRVLSDAHNHASIIDAMRLARCHKVIVPHLDVAALHAALATPHTQGFTYIVTESLFSMDGDIAPLDIYADLAERYQAGLIIDDSHGTGVFGDQLGSGLTEHFAITQRALAVVSTCGKALGVCGAFVAGSQLLCDYLVNVARPFIFTTAPAAYVVNGIHAALDVLALQPRRGRLARQKAQMLRYALHRAGVNILNTSTTNNNSQCGNSSPIVPVLLGDNATAMHTAQALQSQGFDVRAVRPPTVAPGTARLRISVHADHRDQDLNALAQALCSMLQRPNQRAYA